MYARSFAHFTLKIFLFQRRQYFFLPSLIFTCWHPHYADHFFWPFACSDCLLSWCAFRFFPSLFTYHLLYFAFPFYTIFICTSIMYHDSICSLSSSCDINLLCPVLGSSDFFISLCHQVLKIYYYLYLFGLTLVWFWWRLIVIFIPVTWCRWHLLSLFIFANISGCVLVTSNIFATLFCLSP